MEKIFSIDCRACGRFTVKLAKRPGKCSKCGMTWRMEANRPTLQIAELDARVSENHKCDDRCTHAKGYICNCSCGGFNHGINSPSKTAILVEGMA